jgi:hypothetical protein
MTIKNTAPRTEDPTSLIIVTYVELYEKYVALQTLKITTAAISRATAQILK